MRTLQKKFKMGIVENLLAEFKTPSGTEYQIEYNEDGIIHIHTEHIRVDLTVEEFLQLAETVSEGKRELERIKDDL